jgi:hypothetical protein
LLGLEQVGGLTQATGLPLCPQRRPGLLCAGGGRRLGFNAGTLGRHAARRDGRHRRHDALHPLAGMRAGQQPAIRFCFLRTTQFGVVLRRLVGCGAAGLSSRGDGLRAGGGGNGPLLPHAAQPLQVGQACCRSVSHT